MRNRSIRFRLTVWYSFALTVGLIIFGLATWLTMRHSLLGDLHRALVESATSVQSFISAELANPHEHLEEELDEYSHGFPKGSYLRVSTGTGKLIFTSNPLFPWPANGSNQLNVLFVKWHRHRYLLLCQEKQIDGQLFRLSISTSVDEAERLLGRLRLFLLTLLPVVMGVATIGGGWLSRRALKPVDELTQAARSISFDNLSERLSVPQTGDELERLAQTWNSMLSRLEQSVGRLSRFTADASHELRNPVAIIRTTAEIANRRDRPTDDYRQALIQIISESERMTNLLDDLLLLARIDSESVELPMANFDLTALVGFVCSQMLPLAERKTLRLEWIRPAEAVYLTGNEPAIRRLILVLIDNAVKYSRTGGHVRIALDKNGENVQLNVSDSGPGVLPEELPLIFDRFYRSARGREANPEGTGLGLSLAADIAQRHNGEIRLNRSSEEGSTFTFAVVQPKV